MLILDCNHEKTLQHYNEMKPGKLYQSEMLL